MKSLKGQLLVADESLGDPNFARSVVLLFDHGEHGAGGVILNKPTDKTIFDIAPQLFGEPSDWRKIIHLGGPVPGPLAIAHTDESAADMTVADGLFSTIAAAKVLELIKKKVEPSLVIFNYAGWGAGQLESELAEDAWKLWPARPDHIFRHSPKDLWTAVMHEINGQSLAKMVRMKTKPTDPLAN
jgi:putative transcriptional regulator